MASTIKTYNEHELPFGITAANISTISGMKEPEAVQLVQTLSKQPNTGVVNALSVFAALISLGDELATPIDTRIEALYDLIDFDYTCQVTHDELVVLFLCFGTALAGILKQRPEPASSPDDASCRRLAGQLYQEMDKDLSDILSKSEFCAWAIGFVSELEGVSVETVHTALFCH